MNALFLVKCIDKVNDVIIKNEKEIESLDRAIGDGDHFINLKRGCNAIQSINDELLPLNNSQIFQRIGMKILSTVGGASGPLFATFFLEISKTIKDSEDELRNFCEGFTQAVNAIKKRGKSDIGQKTMLDVLIPVAETLKSNSGNDVDRQKLLDAIDTEALKGVLMTKDLIPTKGRAASLGERAVGHIDPGAKSCQLIINAICILLKEIEVKK
tara:strand:+ start:4269 stop:4907 length:639 start_codon:yes stop_codon:yes gene_type:complete